VKLKKIAAVLAMVGVLTAGGAVYAAGASTPPEIASELTGKTLEELRLVRASGKTFGTIANDAGKLEEFKVQIMVQKQAVLRQRVEEGKLTQAQADEIYNSIISNQENCDGTGNMEIGKNAGVFFGQGNGLGNGQGNGSGLGMQNGRGMGYGRNLK